MCFKVDSYLSENRKEAAPLLLKRPQVKCIFSLSIILSEVNDTERVPCPRITS